MRGEVLELLIEGLRQFLSGVEELTYMQSQGQDHTERNFEVEGVKVCVVCVCGGGGAFCDV